MKKAALIAISISALTGLSFLFHNCARINLKDKNPSTVVVAGQQIPAGTLSCAVAPICPNPSPNCEYVNQVTSENGCAQSCGELQCEGPIQCPMIACAPPEEGCSYNSSQATLDSNGCPIDCGPQVCGGPIIECPINMCVAPPEGCTLVPEPPTRENPCPGCGTVVCPTPPPPPPPVTCENAVRCIPLGEGCRYTQDPTYDENGCQTSCGEISCLPPPVACPAIECAPLDRGCSYPNKEYDKKGCLVACGPVQCPAPIACPMIACLEPEGTNCRQVTPPSEDANGCQIDCGQWKCDENPGPITPPLPPTPPGPPVCKPPKACPAIACAPLEEGCHYIGRPEFDKNGCVVSCGAKICKVPPPQPPVNPPGGPIACPMIGFICPEEPGCYWDPRGSVNKNGCQIGCGTKICKDGKKSRE